jgi:hypothetical protein
MSPLGVTVLAPRSTKMTLSKDVSMETWVTRDIRVKPVRDRVSSIVGVVVAMS